MWPVIPPRQKRAPGRNHHIPERNRAGPRPVDLGQNVIVRENASVRQDEGRHRILGTALIELSTSRPAERAGQVLQAQTVGQVTSLMQRQELR
mgnify:CR=1 FL=1